MSVDEPSNGFPTWMLLAVTVGSIAFGLLGLTPFYSSFVLDLAHDLHPITDKAWGSIREGIDLPFARWSIPTVSSLLGNVALVVFATVLVIGLAYGPVLLSIIGFLAFVGFVSNVVSRLKYSKKN